MFRQIMKALSVKQPWASLIASGKKSLEIRTWRTDHRGPLLIVASRTRDTNTDLKTPNFDERLGMSVCLVELVNVRDGTRNDSARAGGVDPTGKFVWEFIDPQPVLPTRIQGRLWVFDVPDELITFESQNLCATLPE